MYDQQEFFKTYFSKATEKPLLIEAFKERFRGSSKESLKILDLGCHDGALVQRLLAAVGDKIPSKVNLIAVDPSALSIDALKKRSFSNSISLEAHVATAEKYFSSSSGSFDWIVASHCLYWSEDLKTVVSEVVNRSTKALIVLRGKFGIYQIQKQFKHLLGNQNEQLYVADDVEVCLKKVGAKYQRQDHQTEISIPASDSNKFKWLISFFLQTDSECLNSSEWESVCAYLGPLGNHLRHDVSFFWVGID